MVFGPYNPIIWVLGPSRNCYECPETLFETHDSCSGVKLTRAVKFWRSRLVISKIRGNNTSFLGGGRYKIYSNSGCRRFFGCNSRVMLALRDEVLPRSPVVRIDQRAVLSGSTLHKPSEPSRNRTENSNMHHSST